MTRKPRVSCIQKRSVHRCQFESMNWALTTAITIAERAGEEGAGHTGLKLGGKEMKEREGRGNMQQRHGQRQEGRLGPEGAHAALDGWA